MTEFAPVATRDRIATLDVLRGFALCGVLIGNLFALYSGRWAKPAPVPDATALDTVARGFMTIFVEGKAQNLLTFLFGLGFGAQLLRARDRGAPVVALYVRRLAVLFVIGALHVALVWWGDVTWGYAVAGFGLLAFLRASNRVRVAVGLALTLVPFSLWVLTGGGRVGLLFLGPKDWGLYTQHLVEATAGTDYAAIMVSHVRYALVWMAPIWIWYIPSLIGRFLLGYVAGVQRWFDRDGADHLALFRRMLWLGSLVAVPSAALEALVHFHVLRLSPALSPIVYTIELFAMTASYVAAIVLLMQRPRWRRALSVVAPAGRMPLTTYVSQSVCATFLFYGWGLGWATPGPAACLGLSVTIFAVQVALARLWLRAFRFGPLEWVWRRLVYLRRPPMRAAA